MTAAIAAWVVAHRRTAWLGLVAATLVAVLFAARIGVSFSSRDFFASSDSGSAAVTVLDELGERWGADDAILLVLVTAEDELRTPAGLAALSRVSKAVGGLASVQRALSIAELGSGPAAEGALRSYPVVPALVSADGTKTVIVVQLRQSSDDLAAVIPTVEAVQSVLAGLDGAGGLHLTAAGVPAVRAAFFSLAVRDQIVLGPLVALVVAIMLWLSFRRLHAVIVPMVAAGLPLLWLLGAMAAADEPIGLLNQAYFTLLPVIAIADAVHWVSRVHEELRRTPNDRDAAIVRAASGVGVACTLTSLTTAAGFLSLLIVDVEMLRRFGGWAAVGVGLSWASVLIVVPLMMGYARRDGGPTGSGVARAVARLSVSHPRVVAFLGLAIIAGAGVGSGSLPVDNRLGALLPAEHPVQRASTTIDEELGGIVSLAVQFSGSGATASQLASFVTWAKAQPEVRWVGDAHSGGLPLRTANGHALVVLHSADIGGNAFTALSQRASERAAEVANVDVVVSGTALLAYTGVNQIAARLRESLVLLLLVVTVVIAVALRSLRQAIVVVPVNVAPLLVGGAVLGVLGYTLDPLAAVIVAVALGIAVDDTVHLMVRTKEERNAGRDPADAVVAAASHSGRAVIVTTLALAAGLSVQMLASFPPLRLLGGLGATIVIAALVVDLTLLPALLALRQATAQDD